MTQNYLIKTLLESNSGKDLIAEIMNGQKDSMTEWGLSNLQANPATEAIIDQLDKQALDGLKEELLFIETGAQLQGFKAGVDLALTLMGKEPVYNALPDKIQGNF